MAIGTLAAIGLGVAGIGTALGSKSAGKAATKSANIAANTATENNALTREIYGENKSTLAPYVNQGVPASYALNSFLGLTPTQQPSQPQPNALAQFQGPTYGYEGMDGTGRAYSVQEPDIYGYNSINGAQFGGFNNGPFAQVQQSQQPSMTSGPDAFKQFIANSDYGFQFGEGANKVNSGYAGAGTIKSGAAMKALEDYRQNLQSGYRGEFLNLLGNQQGVGLSAAAAQAGVATQMGNTISANNNSAGTAAANAALLKGQNNPFANALGVVGGGLFGLGK